ncbi:MAG: amidophosphoribosyltransferase [Bacteroidota bacterium]|nr:amidophosphoribosyltransferase [Bacteroidota bacterium]
MSEPIKHECGIVLLRLLKSPEYYKKKYKTSNYGLSKLYLLMEKQHNRGQDGAGVVSMDINAKPGEKYIFRERSNGNSPIKEVFDNIEQRTINNKNQESHFAGELMMGHLRYGTFGNNGIESVHPVMRQNNWRSRNLVLAGNFNMTNVDELFTNLTNYGQHPADYNDTVTVLENIGHFLDEENQGLFELFKKRGLSKKEISPLIEKNMDLVNILRSSSRYWDGGYVISGIIGHGDSFALRDPNGIRPAYYYANDEVAVVTSERPVIQTVFNVKFEEIKEIKPGHALIIGKNGDVNCHEIKAAGKKTSCSFERIYFSRGTDKQIYRERKKLGELVIPEILEAINHDIKNTVFSFIPNTAETSFLGMIKAAEDYLNKAKKEAILALDKKPTNEQLDKILSLRARVEKIAVKDAKLRTFITQDSDRDDLVGHVYDVSYGAVQDHKDNLVVIDDSIVRGTTLKQSIIKILDRLNPKSIIIVSSSPQIRYPDCYGIDMANLQDFIAFRAATALLKDHKKEDVIKEVYSKSKAQENYPKEKIKNYIKEIYKPFTAIQISEKIAELISSKHIKAPVTVIYQSIENLHKSSPNHTGDWYFTGNYPTPGGNKVVNKAFINYYEGKTGRAY